MSTTETIAYLESHGLAIGGRLIPPGSVQPRMLIPLCDAYLSGRLSADALQQIAHVFLQRPDRDDSSPELDYCGRVERVLYEWYAPEIYFPVTERNVSLLRDFLGGADWKPMTRYNSVG